MRRKRNLKNWTYMSKWNTVWTVCMYCRLELDLSELDFAAFLDWENKKSSTVFFQHLCRETNRFLGCVFVVAVALAWDGQVQTPVTRAASGRSLCAPNISDGKPQNLPVPAWNQSDENPTEWGEIPLIGTQQKFSISPQIGLLLRKSGKIH